MLGFLGHLGLGLGLGLGLRRDPPIGAATPSGTASRTWPAPHNLLALPAWLGKQTSAAAMPSLSGGSPRLAVDGRGGIHLRTRPGLNPFQSCVHAYVHHVHGVRGEESRTLPPSRPQRSSLVNLDPAAVDLEQGLLGSPISTTYVHKTPFSCVTNGLFPSPPPLRRTGLCMLGERR
ncbi:hypothetical protein GGS23DRAFT_462072 [Durotheca rogersii]|uniref:uncharacterized protein n=1 Tax=Durotheca rogersii TaxID=419775 RepID=UPI0022203B41|nr:uncharacterized protein GGS23DRAFT_462072 [Durotheca rogersii]KAI5864755.1 hypothetical protein GGS23DRAFT_462072 [Durotheca rogersii]